jgi:hypothetical protein
VKRLAGIVVVAVCALSAPAAVAQQGAPDFDIAETPHFLAAKGPGFAVLMTKHGIVEHIDDERFGIPEAGFPIVRSRTELVESPTRRPYVCENGTYRLIKATFDVVQRGSSTEQRPLPYTPEFALRFPQIITFFGTLEGVVENEQGERFRLLATDLAHEVMTPDEFASTAPVHGFIVDSQGRVRDRASLVGLVNIDRETGEARHKVVDRGTCHQTANLNLGPNTDQAVVFGNIFVLPFNTTVVRR